MIGVFDSGSGGLTVLQAIRDRLPSADVLYFGDIAHAPYGEKSREELSDLTVNALHFLREQGATSIVSACNSVSASLALSLLDAFDLPAENLIEMAGPTVAYFRSSPARVLLCATPATIGSGMYQNAFRMIGKDIGVVAIPRLAGAIEFGASNEEQEEIIRTAFARVDFSDYDVLILACTHYPLAVEVFKTIIPIPLYDPAEAVAERVKKQLWPREAGDGKLCFVISQDSPQFRTLVADMFPESHFTIEVVQ